MIVGRILAAVVLFGGWEVLAQVGDSTWVRIPTFSEVCVSLVRLLGDAAVWVAMGQTLRATFIGLGLCVLIGVPVGLLIASHRYVVTSTRFAIDFLRTVPPLAVVPLFLLLLGPTPRMEVLLVFAVGVWPVLLQSLYGVRDVDPELLRTARSFRLPLWRRLTFVVAPAAMPSIATGIRICATLSLLLAIGTELIAGVPGLGQEILLSQGAGVPSRMFAQILIAGALGLALSLVVSAVERRLLAWHFRPRLVDAA